MANNRNQFKEKRPSPICEWAGKFCEYYLDVLAVLFLTINMMLFYIDNEFFSLHSFPLYHLGIILISSALVINIYRLNLIKGLSTIAVLLLVFLVVLYNSYSIIMDFNGIIVDMGERSRILLMQAFPGFLLVLLLFWKISRPAFGVAMASVGLIATIYAGIAVYAFITETTELWDFSLVSFNRFQSILNNPNAFGELCFIGFVALLYLIIVIDSTIAKIAISPLTVLLLLGIVLSGSRTALLMTIIFSGVILAYYNYHERKQRVYLIVTFVLAIMLVVYLAFGGFPELIDHIRADFDTSGRDKIWYNILKIISDDGLKGIGYGNLTYVYNERFRVLTSAHNMYLGIYAELGFIGFSLILLWLVFVFVGTHNRIIVPQTDRNRKYLIVANALLIAFLVGQMTEFSFLHISTINTFILAFIGFSFNIRRRIKPVEDRLKILDLVLFLVIAGVSFYGMLAEVQDGNITCLLIIISLGFVIIKEVANLILSRIEDRKQTVVTVEKGK